MSPENNEDVVVSADAPPPVIVYVYKGQGGFMPGIPARDLVQEDLEGLDVELLEPSGLYEKKVNADG